LLAEELESVVSMFIEKEWADRMPSIDDVSDLIEKVLVETGHASTAKAFILERDRRARIRAALRVRSDARPGAEGMRAAGAPGSGGPEVDARSHATVSSWSKGKVVEALMVEGDLPPQEAEEIAASVERRVFASGLTRVSTQLIRALVDNELFERGHDRILNRQAVIGLPRYDLDRLARSGIDVDENAPGCADAADHLVAAACWSQYSLSSIYPGPAVDAHLTGQLFLGGLAGPSRYQALDVDVGDPAKVAWLREMPGIGLADALRMFTGRLAQVAAETVTLRGVHRLLVPRIMAPAADLDQLSRNLLVALATPSDLPARRPAIQMRLPLQPDQLYVDLCVGQGGARDDAVATYRQFVIDLLRNTSVLSGPLRCPRILIEVSGPDPDVEILELACMAEDSMGAAAVLVEPAVGGTLSSFIPVISRIDVNVAQAAFRARRFETRAVIDNVEAAIRVAAEACEARARYVNGLPGHVSPRDRLRCAFSPGTAGGSADASPALGSSGRFEIGLAGLDAACRVAFDKSLDADDRAREFATSVLDAAAAVVAQESAARRLPMMLSLTGDEAVLSRFGRIDFERFSRGRDVHGVPHDGARYLYRASLGVDIDATVPEEAGDIEAALRRGTVPTPIPGYHSHASDRTRFIRRYADRLHGDSA